MRKVVEILGRVGQRPQVAVMVLISSVLIALILTSCLPKNQIEDYTTVEVWSISEMTENRVVREFGEAELECMIVASSSLSRSRPFYVPIGRIRGFEFQAGYRSKIEVIVTHLADPPQDSSDEAYALNRILSREKV